MFSLLVVCTCAYMRRVPRLKQWFLSEKKGFLGVFYKGKLVFLVQYINRQKILCYNRNNEIIKIQR